MIVADRIILSNHRNTSIIDNNRTGLSTTTPPYWEEFLDKVRNGRVGQQSWRSIPKISHYNHGPFELNIDNPSVINYYNNKDNDDDSMLIDRHDFVIHEHRQERMLSTYIIRLVLIMF